MSALLADYSVRALTSSEWAVFSAIRLEALQNYPHFFGSSYAKEAAYSPEDWQKWLSRPDSAMFVLQDGTSVIGVTVVIAAKDDPKAGIMIASYIRKEYQGRGLSSLLYRARIEWALQHSVWKKLVIGHREGNEASRRANQKWGFRFVQNVPKAWPDGTIADDCLYELDLQELRLSHRLTLT